ncbi:hypothetical protein O6H91_11G091000 [Diphasiastrum complanatum]|uniref:Uncharacterized protein n=2 Tax=Diphasiastrum complanatum TaxID=34168 RepID=A0ACC2CBR0_DIPCM|nr:hypothetical protein O6H91_11G090500 [Diphasiastrum complanatum]KAJ7539409.1 hypothetical protein O6H91_11G091000 [Diphasiastrum complanatum]
MEKLNGVYASTAQILQQVGESNQSGNADRDKVCILSIDGGGMRGLIPAFMLGYLEEALQRRSGNPNARIADYFDIGTGTSVGAWLIAMLFLPDEKGTPLFTGQGTWKYMCEYAKDIFRLRKLQRPFSLLRGMISPKYSTRYWERLLQKMFVRDGKPYTLKDPIKPLLLPCYDLATAGPFIFSTSDAKEYASSDFRLWEVIRASSAVPGLWKPAFVTSTDSSRSIPAVDGGLVLSNPTAAAITHVLHNKRDFPSTGSVHDMLILSLGTGQFAHTYQFKEVRGWGALQWLKPIARMIFDSWADMVDHTISNAYGKDKDSYLRIQVAGLPDQALAEMDDPSTKNVHKLSKLAKDGLDQRTLEFLPFGGKKPHDLTNRERLEWFAEQLIKEREARATRKLTNGSHISTSEVKVG